MSTSDPDLEDRLASLRPAAPRENLRDEVLTAVARELGTTARPAFLDRPSTWAVAATVLLALVVALVWTNREQERRIEAFATRPTDATEPSLEAWRHRDALLAQLLDNGDRDE